MARRCLPKMNAPTCRRIQEVRRLMSARACTVWHSKSCQRGSTLQYVSARWQALFVSENVKVSWKLYHSSSPLPPWKRREEQKRLSNSGTGRGLGPNRCNKSDVWDVTQWLAQYITLKTQTCTHTHTLVHSGVMYMWVLSAWRLIDVRLGKNCANTGRRNPLLARISTHMN